MNLIDILTLAKAGYKKADIKELLEYKDQEPEQKPEPEKQPEPEIDYKAEFEKQKLVIDELNSKISKIQTDNKGKNLGGNVKTDEELLEDALNNLL